MTICTDHTAVKETPNLTGKHACWWSKILGSGIGEVNIVHRAGKRNQHADALSRQPVIMKADYARNYEIELIDLFFFWWINAGYHLPELKDGYSKQ